MRATMMAVGSCRPNYSRLRNELPAPVFYRVYLFFRPVVMGIAHRFTQPVQDRTPDVDIKHLELESDLGVCTLRS